ncbi:hypothetical protein KCU88_g162, partial [Aureobasidium melanogenum]
MTQCRSRCLDRLAYVQIYSSGSKPDGWILPNGACPVAQCQRRSPPQPYTFWLTRLSGRPESEPEGQRQASQGASCGVSHNSSGSLNSNCLEEHAGKVLWAANVRVDRDAKATVSVDGLQSAACIAWLCSNISEGSNGSHAGGDRIVPSRSTQTVESRLTPVVHCSGWMTEGHSGWRCWFGKSDFGCEADAIGAIVQMRSDQRRIQGTKNVDDPTSGCHWQPSFGAARMEAQATRHASVLTVTSGPSCPSGKAPAPPIGSSSFSQQLDALFRLLVVPTYLSHPSPSTPLVPLIRHKSPILSPLSLPRTVPQTHMHPFSHRSKIVTDPVFPFFIVTVVITSPRISVSRPEPHCKAAEESAFGVPESMSVVGLEVVEHGLLALLARPMVVPVWCWSILRRDLPYSKEPLPDRSTSAPAPFLSRHAPLPAGDQVIKFQDHAAVSVQPQV